MIYVYVVDIIDMEFPCLVYVISMKKMKKIKRVNNLTLAKIYIKGVGELL